MKDKLQIDCKAKLNLYRILAVGYNGLPGLVLELKTNRKIYYAKKKN